MEAMKESHMEHDNSPSSPCYISTVFSDEPMSQLYLGDSFVMATSNATRRMAGVCLHWRVCSIAVIICACALLMHDWASNAIASSFFEADVICGTVLCIVGTTQFLYWALQLNREWCRQAHATHDVARAQWVRQNTQLHPDIIAERRRLLFQCTPG